MDLAAIENDIVRIIQNMNATEGIDMDTLTALTGAYSPLDRQVGSFFLGKMDQIPEKKSLIIGCRTNFARRVV